MRLIDADSVEYALMAIRDRESGVPEILAEWLAGVVCTAPTVDAEVLTHGRWVIHSTGHGVYANNWAECSECGTCGSPQWKRCPVCEAKMDKGE